MKEIHRKSVQFYCIYIHILLTAQKHFLLFNINNSGSFAVYSLVWGRQLVKVRELVEGAGGAQAGEQVSTVAATMLWQRSIAASSQLINRQLQDCSKGETPPRGGAGERTTPVTPPEASQQGKCLKKKQMSASRPTTSCAASSLQFSVLSSDFLFPVSSSCASASPCLVIASHFMSDFRNHLSLVFSCTCPPGSCSVIITTCALVSQLCPLPLITPVYVQRCHPLIVGVVFLLHGICFPFTSIFLQVGS